MRFTTICQPILEDAWCPDQGDRSWMVPLSDDGVIVIPSIDTVWIDAAEAGGWPDPDETADWRIGDEDPDPVIVSQERAWHGDHIGIMIDGEWHHWFGRVWSSEAAARAAAAERMQQETHHDDLHD